jgi:mono/diheme cytochrome c family protein
MIRCRHWGAIVALVLGVIGFAASRIARSADDDEPETAAPGLVAEYSSGEVRGPAIARVVPNVVGRWDDGSPDARIPASNFIVRWSGFLLIQAPGTHRFHAQTDGTLTLKLAGRVALSGTAGSVKGDPVELPAGFVPLVLEYRHAQGDAHVALDWEGPTFRREPVPARLLFHDAGRGDPKDLFEQGRQLADRLGCANCHAVLDLPRHPSLGPPLNDAGRAIKLPWLDAWLANPAAVRAATRMPAFGNGLSPGEVADLRAFLVAQSRSSAPTDEIKMALNVASASNGQLLFRSVGCLACHTLGARSGDESPSAGPDLSGLSTKRELSQLAAYLVHPRGEAGSKHRADLRLSPDESAHLASYLLSGSVAKPRGEGLLEGDAARGRELFERLRCASCHELRGIAPPAVQLKLTASSRTDRGCLSKTSSAPSVPRFSLSDNERAALREFVSRLPTAPARTPTAVLAADQIRRRNCFGCHSREGEAPALLGSKLAELLKSDPALGALKGSLTPPNLTAVGDKLRPEYLADAVRGKAPTARPWLAVRMPNFAFEPREAEAIVEHFRAEDRMLNSPDVADSNEPLVSSAVESAARLIGQKGFGCVSCHVMAGRIPPGGEPETLGPDLTLAHRRLSERYFKRWIENPQRIIAGTSMPQFIKPAETGTGSLDQQLTVIWRLLGNPRAADLALSGTKEFLKRQGDRALVVFDMVIVPQAPGTPFTPRGVAIGLKNDQTLLFDADRLSWLAWWQGGFLSRTKSGRLWEWHPEGTRLWTAAARRPPVVFIAPDGSIKSPTEERERFGHFSSIEFHGAGVVVSYALNAPGGGPARVTERIQPLDSGWVREVTVSGVPEGYRPGILESVPGATSKAGSLRWSAGEIRLTLSVDGAEAVPATGLPGKDVYVFALGRTGERSHGGRLKLSAERRP